MLRHLRPVGGGLAAASLATVGAYFVAAVTSSSPQPWWPYLLLSGLTALGGLSYLIGQRDSRTPPAVRGTDGLSLVGEKDHAVAVRVGRVPLKPPGFQPRTDLLAKLDERGDEGRVPLVCTMIGMRGAGKTQLAAAYARARMTDSWRLVAWVNAENADAVSDGLAAVAAGLRLDNASTDSEGAADAVRHCLEADGDRCLVVFDNAADPDDLQRFLPAEGDARVLITTTQQPVADLGACIPVEVFTEQEALAFLAERTQSTDSDGARLLAGELGYLPLALAQAAAVIRARRLDCGAYLNQLRAEPVDGLLVQVKGGQYPYGVAAAVLLSLEVVREDDDTGLCGTVMDVVSVLSPAGVSRGMLHAVTHPGGALPEQVDQALGLLADSSLLTFSVDRGSVSAHGLVMRVIRERRLQEGRFAAVCRAAAVALEAGTAPLEQVWQDRSASRDLVEHVLTLQGNSARCPGGTDIELTRALLRLRLWALGCLNELGDNPERAISIGVPLVADSEQVLGPDDPDTLDSRNNLAVAYLKADRAENSIPLFERNLAERERDSAPDILTSQNNLAAAYLKVGRLDEAIGLFEQAVKDREHALGPDAPGTLTTRCSLAASYAKAGRLSEAIPLLQQTLADQERVLEPGDPRILTSRTNLALMNQQANSGEAIRGLEQILAEREHTLGHDHPDTLAAQFNVAFAYLAAGRKREAVPLLERALADCERVLPDKPLTQRVRQYLSSARA